MKTVLIVVTQGLVCRNFMRGGVLDRLLRREDIHLVILFPPGIPDDLRKEFSHPRVTLDEIPLLTHGYIRGRFFAPFSRNLLFSRTRRSLMKYGSGKMKRYSLLGYYAACLFYWPLSKIPWLKTATEWVEARLYPDREVAFLFERYHPDAVVALSLLSKEDVAVIKNAKRLGIPTLGMPKGWDTLDKFHFEVKPDLFAVQNPCMVRFALDYHGYRQEQVRVVGFPLFDLYQDQRHVWSRERTCADMGLDPSRPYFIYGSEGIWSRDELPVVERMVRWIQDDAFGRCSLVIRPYFGFVKNHQFAHLRDVPNIVIDDKHRIRKFFKDGWDPPMEEIVRFINLLRHSAGVICVRSTLSLDAAVLDRPVINVGYHAYIDSRGKDLTETFYNVEFYQDVLKTGGVDFVRDEEGLLRAMEDALRHPERKTSERRRLVEQLCYKVDGHAADRLAAAILECAHQRKGLTT